MAGELRVVKLRAGGTAGSGQLRVARIIAGGAPVATGELRVARLRAGGTPVTPAEAGPDRVDIEPGSTVQLDASASGAGTYSWTLLSAVNGSSPALTGGTTATPTYKAPSHRDGEVLVWRVTVNGQTDTVRHTILPQALWRWNGSALVPARFI